GLPATVILSPTSTAETWSGGSSLTVIPGAGGGVNNFPAGAIAGAIEVPIVAGTGTFIWEIFGQNPTTIATVSFSVALGFRAANNPGIGQINVNGSFAPISTDNKMSASSPIPRFADQSTAQASAQIVVCQTDLLFPFVTNQGGFDTGVAI